MYMDETLDKIDLAPNISSFSAYSLFLEADIVVKIVMVILTFFSLWSWTIIFSKFSYLKRLINESDEFEEKFYACDTLQKLSKKLGSHPSHPLESVFFSAMGYVERIKLNTGMRNNDFKINFCERIEREMNIVMEREIGSLSVHMNFLASVGSTAPFVGLFGTVWGIMNSFQSIAMSNNTSLAVVAPGIAEALFATALGLLAAIPAVAAYNKYLKDIDMFNDKSDHFGQYVGLYFTQEIDKR